MRALFIVFLSFLLIPTTSAGLRARQECVRIYYDRSPGELSQVYATYLENLLGHFPKFQTFIAPLETYSKGQLNECRASFYLGSYFNVTVPRDFLDDFATTNRSVAWLGYSVWQLGTQRLQEALGLQYLYLTQLDRGHLDPRGAPSFFSTIHYKGEQFRKFSKWDPQSGQFMGAFEMAAVKKLSDKAQILAEAEQSATGEKLPYIVRSANRYYVADIPFSFMHEEDRYLVFADVLFDILGEQPIRAGKKPAVFRIEDVSTNVPESLLLGLGSTLKKLNIPFHLATIPIYADPANIHGLTPDGKLLSIADDPKFQKTLSQLQAMGGKIIWHGVTHQLGNAPNPDSGVSGDDFEFWDYKAHAPVPGDSVDYVIDRLDLGWKALSSAGFKPKIWEVPHYWASSLDYYVFANVFSWNIGRVMYSADHVKGLPESFPAHMTYGTDQMIETAKRKQPFENLSVEESGNPVGQFFPYEIYGDHYGQNLLPENLGLVSPCEHPIRKLLETAKRNKVLRDAWGSFFFHPFLLSPGRVVQTCPYPTLAEVQDMVLAMQDMGYEFIDLEKFIETQSEQSKRPRTAFIP